MKHLNIIILNGEPAPPTDNDKVTDAYPTSWDHHLDDATRDVMDAGWSCSETQRTRRQEAEFAKQED